MKVVAFIVEYNPFHNGHKYHLEHSLSATKATHSIAVMSSSFVQRGEPALVDKWTRAKMAIENGVDLVLELPFVYACQSAELFAQGAIRLINSLKVVDYLSFGSEVGDLAPLRIIAQILESEPLSYVCFLKHYLSKGFSFPVSRSHALSKQLKKENIYSLFPFEEMLKGSNNILAIEYLKALIRYNSNISPITIGRSGANYKDIEARGNIASATGIRHSIFSSDLCSVKNYVPEESFVLLKEFQSKYKTFNSLNNYSSIMRYLLLTKNKQDIINILDVEDGLENRIIEKFQMSRNISSIVNLIKTKRYPTTRIQRVLMHLLNGLDGNQVRSLYENDPQYVRVLASNKQGLELLYEIKNKSKLNIISKYSNYRRLQNNNINRFLSFEERATDLFYLGLNTEALEVNKDYLTTPYIK